MRGWMVAVGVAVALGGAGAAFAQGDVIAERRAGYRAMGQMMEAMAQAVQNRGDTRALVPRIDQSIAFVTSIPTRFPANSLTPPQPQGVGEGQTRGLAVIDTDRATFQTRATNMVTALTALKAAAEGGTVTADVLRSTGGACGACHQAFRAR